MNAGASQLFKSGRDSLPATKSGNWPSSEPRWLMFTLQGCRRTKGSFHCLTHLTHPMAYLFTQAKTGAMESTFLHLNLWSGTSLNPGQKLKSSKSNNPNSQLRNMPEEGMSGRRSQLHLDSQSGKCLPNLYPRVSKKSKMRNLDLLPSQDQQPRLKKKRKMKSLRAHGSLRLCHATSLAPILLSQNLLWPRKIKSGVHLRKRKNNKNHRMIQKLPQPNLIHRKSRRKSLRAQLILPSLPPILALNRPKIQRKSPVLPRKKKR